MARRWADWFRQAEADMEHAREALGHLLDRARALDKLYVPTRYPNGLPAGAPADYFTAEEARRAIADAEAVLAFCRGVLPR